MGNLVSTPSSTVRISAGDATRERLSPPPPGKHGNMVLLQAQVVFRHGARTPMRDLGSHPVQWLPSEQACASGLPLCNVSMVVPFSGAAVDPATIAPTPQRNRGMLLGGGFTGMLTRAGMRHALDLGAELRRRYVDPSWSGPGSIRRDAGYLLPPTWALARRQVFVSSTKVPRTVATAQGVLSGIFPADAERGTMELDVHLNAERERDEHHVLQMRNCDRLKWLFKRGVKASVTAPHQSEASRAVRKVVEADAAGWKQPEKKSDWSLIAYRDQLSCRLAEGKRVPPGILAHAAALDAAAAEQMHTIFSGGYAHGTSGYDEAVRLTIGRMVNHVIDTMQRPDGRVHFLSGHDWTVSPLLMCITRPRPHEPALRSWPPFCSNLTFELWSDREEDKDKRAVAHVWATTGDAEKTQVQGRVVRAIFNGDIVDMPCSPTGQETCSLEAFRDMVQRYRVVDFADECRVVGERDDAAASGSSTAAGSGEAI